MKEKSPLLLFASAAALTLALQQGAFAATEAGAQTAAVQANEAPPPAQQSQAAPAPEAPATAAGADTGAAPLAGSPSEPMTDAAPVPDAAQEPAPAAAAAPEPVPSAAPAAEDARAQFEARHAEMMEQRRKRYEELRSRAAAVGLELPDPPPWDESAMSPPEMPSPPAMPSPPEMAAPPPMPEMPEMPAMASPPEFPAPPAMPAPPETPAARAPVTAEEREAMREERYKAMRERAAKTGIEFPEIPPWKLMTAEERKDHWEKMRNMTLEEREAARERHWAEMRERAAKRGVEMPETPPWRQAQQRREEMRGKWDSYRQIIEQMTDEQREAAAAVFGRASTPPREAMPQMPQMPQMPPQPSHGRDVGAPQPIPNRMPHPRMMPGYGGHSGPGPWSGGNEGMMQPPPPPASGLDQGW